LAQVDIVHSPDGSIDIVDNTPTKWEPSDKQTAFLEHLLDSESGNMRPAEAMQAVKGTMRELKCWCRREPEFLALFKQRAIERFEVSDLIADLTIAASLEGGKLPTQAVRWGIQARMKTRDFIHRQEIRYIQINQHFNVGPQADDDDEALQKVIDAASQTVQGAIAQG
jgi:hypothetical protein